VHPDRIEWPPTRLDLFSLTAVGVVAYSAVEHEWIMVGVALFAVLIAVVLPRMRGPFEVSGPVRFKGELLDPQAPSFKGVVDSTTRQQPGTGQPDPSQPPAPPEQTQPRED